VQASGTIRLQGALPALASDLIAGGREATIRFRPTSRMRAVLDRRGKLSAPATARLTGTPAGDAVKRRVTILRERKRG
jgi:hypothetical protein